jgi:recombination protein RecT
MSQATATQEGANLPAKAEPSNPTTIVGKQVRNLLEKGALHLPADYSAENALKEAWLILQQTEGYASCTQESIINALLDMVIWGLNPGKKQVYLIPYGKVLTCQRSYFGEMALAERLRPGIAIYADVIYQGEKFSTTKIRSKSGFITVVNEHEQPFPRPSKEIIGAYCGAIDTETGEDLGIELMDMEQIRTSWKKSKTIGSGKSFHTEQPDLACKRTVIRRWSKAIINSSSDALLLESIRRAEEDSTLADLDEEEAANANGKIITLPIASAELPANAQTQPETTQNGQPEERIGKAPKDDQAAPAEEEAKGEGLPF